MAKMIIYFVLSTFLLNHCVAKIDLDSGTMEDRLNRIKMTNLQYRGGKFYIDCIHGIDDQEYHRVYFPEFNMTDVKKEDVEENKTPKKEDVERKKIEEILLKKNYDNLIEKLSNGKDLSLFFMGIGATISLNGYDFRISKEWFRTYGRNICFISYDCNHENSISEVIDMVKTRRLDFIAKKVGELVLAVQHKCRVRQDRKGVQNMTHVEVIGHSIGAHIGNRMCRYLYVITGTKVKFLLGIDAAGIRILFLDAFGKDAFDKDDCIQSGDAQYVQNIHTSAIMGTNYYIADVDIDIKWNCESEYLNQDYSKFEMKYYEQKLKKIVDKHAVGVELFYAIRTKKLVLIAQRKGDGEIILQKDVPNEKRIIAENECLVGVFEEKRNGKFKISFANKEHLLDQSLEQFGF